MGPMGYVIHALCSDHNEGGVVCVGHVLPRHVDHLVIGVSGPAMVVLNSGSSLIKIKCHLVVLLTSIRGTGAVLEVS